MGAHFHLTLVTHSRGLPWFFLLILKFSWIISHVCVTRHRSRSCHPRQTSWSGQPPWKWFLSRIPYNDHLRSWCSSPNSSKVFALYDCLHDRVHSNLPNRDACAKGTKTETFTITQTYAGGKKAFTPPVIPPNFTTPVQVCDACAGKPTLTVTCPLTQITSPPVCTGAGCPVSPPVKAPCSGPDCPPIPHPGYKCPGPDCPPIPHPGSKCPGPDCPPIPGSPCPGPNCPSTPTPGSSCPGPNCPPSPPAKVVCPGPACPSGSSNTTTPPHITANSGSSGHVHMVAILLGATVGLAAFCL